MLHRWESIVKAKDEGPTLGKVWRESQLGGQILNIHCRRIELLLPDRNIEIVACSRRSSRNRGAKVASKRTENKTRAETESSAVVS